MPNTSIADLKSVRSSVLSFLLLLVLLIAIFFYWVFGINTLNTRTVIEFPTDKTLELPFECVFDGTKTDFDNESKIVLFRGVHYAHPCYEDALNGIARPQGGHDNPIQHNLGDNKSIFTSWTCMPYVALYFANRKKQSGVVLVQIFEKEELIKSSDKFEQGEFLIKGLVKNCLVLRL